MLLCVDFSIDLSSLFDFEIIKNQPLTCILIFVVGVIIGWLIQKYIMKIKLENIKTSKEMLENEKKYLTDKSLQIEGESEDLKDVNQYKSAKVTNDRFLPKEKNKKHKKRKK